MDQFERKCSVCNSQGYLYFDRDKTCPICEGRGSYALPGQISDWQKCNHCDGQGYYYFNKEKICSTCGGYGLISKVADIRKPPNSYRKELLDSANAETQTKDFIDWAGGERCTLAIVFTDIVDSTALGQELGDEGMEKVRNAHFAQGRKLMADSGGREIKNTGDGLMVAFHNAENALDFAASLYNCTGHTRIRIRAGIHIGPLDVDANDTFGGTVNFSARVAGACKGAGIWLSNRAKEDIDTLKAKRHSHMKWDRHDDVPMKGFAEGFTLWSLAD